MKATRLKRSRISRQTHKILDPLTSFPEPLLHHILSYLKMRDVIRTSVLSKRWRYTWMYVPCLNFPPIKMSRYKEKNFINQSLLLHKGPAIQKFSLAFPYPSEDERFPHVDSWIYFAKTRNVKELYLDFSDSGGLHLYHYSCHNDFYRLPPLLFSLTSLTFLSLVKCEIHFPVKFKLSSLKRLSLKQVNFSGGQINDLRDSTPILESLSLSNCQVCVDLDVYMDGWSTVKALKIDESVQKSSDSALTISAGHIASFELITSMPRGFYFVPQRMKSLERASFKCDKGCCRCGRYEVAKENMVFEILDNVRHAKYLSVCCCYVQALCRKEELSRNRLHFDATCLAIRTNLSNGELPGIGYMLRHSPNIETLIINIDFQLNNNLEDGGYWKLQEPNFVNLLCNLKEVRINNFMKNQRLVESAPLQKDMDFLRFLLKHSKAMERMAITTYKKANIGRNSENKRSKLLFQLSQELLAFPRASQAAQISLN